MKTIIISTIFTCVLQMSVFSENRICEWDTEKISSIEVKLTKLNFEKEVITLIENHDMDVIISFEGQRDQVYLYKQSACIGKTSFIINQKVIQEFE